jgi:hypothetical protein
MSVSFARLRAATVCIVVTAVLALGPGPSLSAQGQAPSPWAVEYVHFVTGSDGWAMAYKKWPEQVYRTVHDP